MPKKIFILDTGKEWGGGTNSLIELLKRVNNDKFDPSAFFYYDYPFGDQKISEQLYDIGIKFHIIRKPQYSFFIKVVREIARVILFFNKTTKHNVLKHIEYKNIIEPSAAIIADIVKKHSYDLIYMNNQPSSNLEGYLASTLSGKPVIQHARIDVELTKKEISIVNKIASKVICNSNGLQNSLVSQGINNKLTCVIHNGIELSKNVIYCDQNGFNKTGLIIGTVGSLIERKCIDHLLLAFSSLMTKHQNIQLIIVGDGPERTYLERTAAELGILKFVYFTGFKKDPMPWINLMDIFAFCSKQEGFGRVLIEAMLLKKPIVSAKVVGPTDIIIENETGLFYEHGDIPMLTEHISELIDSTERRHDMGSNGYKRVVEYFDIETYARLVQDVWAKTMEPT